MKDYGDGFATVGTVQKAGSTQPYPTGGDGRNPDQGTGAIPAVVGPDSPVIVKTGAMNNGGIAPGARFNRADGRQGTTNPSLGEYGARGSNP